MLFLITLNILFISNNNLENFINQIIISQHMTSKLILLSGGTGVGTSKFAFELAKSLHIPYIQGTDSAREIIRSVVNKDLNPSLSKSTYIAGKTKNYESKNNDVQKSEILRAYKNQCAAVNVAIEGIVNRSLNENISLIVEGIHLLPGKLKEVIDQKGLVNWIKNN